MRTIVAPSSTATSKSWVVPIDSSRSPRSPRGRAARRTSAGCPRDREPSGGIVMSPATGTGQRSRNASSVVGRDAVLALLAGDVDLDEDAQLGRGMAAELRRARSRVQTEWMSRTSGAICLTLRLWTWPMKSHSKASPWAATFAWRSCARFSPTTRHAALGERGERARPARTSRPRRSRRRRDRGPARRRRGRDALAHLGEVRAHALGRQAADLLGQSPRPSSPTRQTALAWRPVSCGSPP